jgi:acyl-CoA synthetase (NDP forming)/GNAT superfamily N-acetyltransferase
VPGRQAARLRSPREIPERLSGTIEEGGEAMPPVYALLADGSTVLIRPPEPADFQAVKAMHDAMSPDNAFMRFFSFSTLAAEREARRVCREPEPGHAALLALSDDEIVGCASYERAGRCQEEAGRENAEVAFAVADRMHHQGIATLLLEHLVTRARGDGIQAFVAETLAENTPMLRVFADAGLPVRRRSADGVIEVTVPLPSDDTDTALDAYLCAVDKREGLADTASLRYLFAPECVVVIGAGRGRGTVGRAILDNIRTGGYKGRLYTVNPHAPQLGGITCLPSAADLPETPDLAIIAVPPGSVTGIAEACGTRGVKALAVVTAGLDTGQSGDLLAICRRHGMRLAGPNSFGIAVPSLGLDATISATHPRPGAAGLVTQSGGIGIAMADRLSGLGIGISSFASVGSKLDVSSNDLLLWWEHDGVTRLAIMYIESFGNPRKFARTARRVGRTMPVLTVHAGRSAAGQQAAAAHTSAAATPETSRQALFEQAGIIATPGLGELTEVTALLATQPVPEGRTVAVISNVGGAGVLAADACTDRGLTVHHPHGDTRCRLLSLVPPGAVVSGPVDTTAAVSSDAFRQCLELLSADHDVDAIIALVLPTAAAGDLIAAIQRAELTVPVAAVVLNQPESVRLLAGRIPAYDYPEAAAGALARAADYGAWRAAPQGEVAALPGISPERARTLVRGFLASAPDGGWLLPAEVAALLAAYGITPVPLTAVRSADDAVAQAAKAEGPVVLKADVKNLLHKTEAESVRLDLRTEDEVRAAYESLTAKFGATLRGVGLQPMITGGTEVLIGVADDDIFGPLIVFGNGGFTTKMPGDHAARLAPLTTADADTLIGSVRAAELLRGYRGAPVSGLAALRDLLLRISRLAVDLPEIAELDFNPVIARPDSTFIVDARVKVMPCAHQDPFLRRLR